MSQALTKVNPTGTAIARAESYDIASLSEDEFEHALARVDTRKRRMHRILESVLVEGAHFGNPNKAFKKPILLLAGADELIAAFRLELITEPGFPDVVIAEDDFASVTVHRAIVDGAGRIVDRTTASCTSKEGRFKKTSGGGWLYDDARAVLNDLHAMAEKRAKVRLVRSCLGLGGFLSSEEEMNASLEVVEEKPLIPMTDDERKALYSAAAKKGLGKTSFLALIRETLGRDKVGSGDDVARVHAAIESWTKPGEAPKAEPVATAEPTPPAATLPAEDVEYQETAPKAADSRDVFGAGNAGPVLPGEIEQAQASAGELPLGDAPKRRNRSAIAE